MNFGCMFSAVLQSDFVVKRAVNLRISGRAEKSSRMMVKNMLKICASF